MEQRFTQIYDRLHNYFGMQNWWPADTVFEMMVGAILVQNTNWRNAEKALHHAKPFLTPEQLDEMPTEELALLIRSSGFYRVKAKRIKAFLKWFQRYDYSVEYIKTFNWEVLRQELLQINGIGRETADVILLYAFAKPIFVVDAYARRIFYRIGWSLPDSYDALRQQVEAELGDDLLVYQEFHALLVEHAKEFCQVKPRCEHCPLQDICEQRSK
ncbi:endonuclease III domain-containing protein [Lentibacillus sp. L22]|uniref:endonuclease III domain-containing protein n=1 Tax=Lentibacillus TaxID=175304 RepID=UPI0022B0D85B|nr:endonuclease III domain-containing protein [Lentibacillus daqui]